MLLHINSKLGYRSMRFQTDAEPERFKRLLVSSGNTAAVKQFDARTGALMADFTRGGKRYDLATASRRLAHATYYASHGTDQESALSFAMDLTPLVEDPALSPADYVLEQIDRFRADVEKRLTQT